jgi:hypothetical protein
VCVCVCMCREMGIGWVGGVQGNWRSRRKGRGCKGSAKGSANLSSTESGNENYFGALQVSRPPERK